MSRATAFAALLLLAGRDHSSSRRVMAECKMDERAGDTQRWDELFLDDCMKTRGYVRDDSGMVSPNLRCSQLMTAASEGACYRRGGLQG